MADGTDDEPVRIDPDKPVDRLPRKLPLEIPPSPLERPGSSHLLSQILQNLMRITIQPINNLSEIHNNRPGTDHLNLGDRKLKTLP